MTSKELDKHQPKTELKGIALMLEPGPAFLFPETDEEEDTESGRDGEWLFKIFSYTRAIKITGFRILCSASASKPTAVIPSLSF